VSQSSALENLYTEELYKVPAAVLVIISKPWDEVSEDERTVLSKMLVAVKLNLAAVQIIIKKEFTIEELSPLSPSRVLVFGSAFKSSSKFYENIVVGGTSVILSESLDKLDDSKKKSLWLALKQMFGI
jgi:hypothetical protein